MNETIVLFTLIFGVPFAIGTIIWAIKTENKWNDFTKGKK